MTLAGMIGGHSREQGVTQRELAHALGMGERTFRRKMADPDAFTVGEVRRMVALLRIPAEERKAII